MRALFEAPIDAILPPPNARQYLTENCAADRYAGQKRDRYGEHRSISEKCCRLSRAATLGRGAGTMRRFLPLLLRIGAAPVLFLSRIAVGGRW